MPHYIEEASADTVLAEFADSGNGPTVPASARYLIRDVTNDRLVRDWTDLTPAAAIEIQVTPTDNTMHETGTRKKFEERVILVEVNTGLDSQRSREITYYVRNQRGRVN